jgi:hypothetical protein
MQVEGPAIIFMPAYWGMAIGSQAMAGEACDVVIRNATVMTASHGTLPNTLVWIHDGKIAAV